MKPRVGLKDVQDQQVRRRAAPRTPSRTRGIVRYEALLDALEALLTDKGLDEVGLYQIAEHAEVPPASVYHFFPTQEAAFLGLAQRYMRGLDALAERPIDPAALASWQTLLDRDVRLAVEYFHAHPPAMKLLLGFSGGLATQQANNLHTGQTGRGTYRRLDLAFHVPALRNARRVFHIAIKIIDSILVMSYLDHGLITEGYRREAVEAAISYLRQYLPQHLELRAEHLEAMALGVPVFLPQPPATPRRARSRQEPANG
jgi:AcrR family transcriptional regulator